MIIKLVCCTNICCWQGETKGFVFKPGITSLLDLNKPYQKLVSGEKEMSFVS